jgi:hypothetical protein
MDDHQPELVPDHPDRRAFLRRMVAAGFALPVIATLDSAFTAEAKSDPPDCHDHPQGHGPGGGHGHEDCTTTTPPPTTTTSTTTESPP